VRGPDALVGVNQMPDLIVHEKAPNGTRPQFQDVGLAQAARSKPKERMGHHAGRWNNSDVRSTSRTEKQD